MNHPMTTTQPDKALAAASHGECRTWSRLRWQTAALAGGGVLAGVAVYCLGFWLAAPPAPAFCGALIGASAFVYLAVAVERDLVGLIGNTLFAAAVFGLALAVPHQPSLFTGMVFLGQGIWSGWVAGQRQAEALAPEALWSWSVFNLTLAALV